MIPSTCDKLIIGSSPSNLMRAVMSARSGEKAVVIDNSDYIGGAWHARPVFQDSDKSYEIATHMLSPFLEEYSMLESSGVELRHRPIIYFDFGASASDEEIKWLDEKIEAPYGKRKPGGAQKLSWSQFFSLADFRTIEDEEYLSARVEMHKAQENQFKYYWPGVAVLLHKLAKNFEDAGGQIIHSADVSTIDHRDSKIIVSTNGGEITCNSVQAGRHLDAEIKFNGTRSDTSPKTNYYYTLMVKCRSANPQPHPYIAIVNHPNLTAIQQCNPLGGEDENITVFCLAGHWGQDTSPLNDANIICREIIANEGFNPDTEIIDAVRIDTQMASLSSAVCDAINEESNGTIVLTSVTNFMLDLKNNHEDWAKALGEA